MEGAEESVDPAPADLEEAADVFDFPAAVPADDPQPVFDLLGEIASAQAPDVP